MSSVMKENDQRISSPAKTRVTLVAVVVAMAMAVEGSLTSC